MCGNHEWMVLALSLLISMCFVDSLGLHKNVSPVCLKNMSTFIQKGTEWQSEANWNCWPLLNHISGDRISFFIGHKWNTSVSTWLSFHTKHLNRDSSPMSAAPRHLLKVTFVSYIKPWEVAQAPFRQRVRLREALITKPSLLRIFSVYTVTQLASNDLFTQCGLFTVNLFDSCASHSPSCPHWTWLFFKFDLKAPHVFDFFLIASCLLGQL